MTSRLLKTMVANTLDRAKAKVSLALGYVGNCQNYGPFLGPYYNTGPNTGPDLGDPKREHIFDNSPCTNSKTMALLGFRVPNNHGFGLHLQTLGN